MKRLLRLTLYGRVQGITLRQNAAAKALELELTGFIRNNQNGSVSLVIQGEEDSITHFLQWMQSETRPWKITQSKNAWSTALGDFSTFEIWW